MNSLNSRDTNADRIWSKAFISIFILNFVMSMGQFMMNTLIPLYAYDLGADARTVGLVTGAFAVTALALRPIAGPSMDYFKKNRLLTCSIGMIAVAFVFYGLSRSIFMLVIARLFHGFAMSVSAPLSLAIVSNIVPNDKMASGLGIFSLGAAIATAIGPTIGLKLAHAISFNATFFICAFLMLVSFVLSLQLKSETPNRSGGFKISFRQIIAPEVLVPTLVMFFLVLAYSGINSFIAIFGELNGIKDIGLYFTASAVCMIFIRPISGRIADKFGHDKSILPGLFILIGALILISFSSTLPMFILAGAVTAFGFGSSQPLIQTMNMQLVPKERRGAAGNTNFMGVDCAFLVGPAIAGSVINTVQKRTGSEILGFSMMFRTMIVPVVIAMVIFWLAKKKLMTRIKTLPQSFETMSTEVQIKAES